MSTDQRAPASEALPVPEVGEQGAAGGTARSGRPDKGDRAQVWPGLAQEHGRRRPLQVRPVQGTHRLSRGGAGGRRVSGHSHDRSWPAGKVTKVAQRLSSVAVQRNSLFNRHKCPSATAPPVPGSCAACGIFWRAPRRRRRWMFSRWSRLYARRDSACSPLW